ncbi:MAG TPA: autotransporter-associated beta strand repeat-containing protein, partial [Roseimicrobium sp.]|nr:autotransporter-associated beta strand repeat-containing protein [Roseimicrobium sp.]
NGLQLGYGTATGGGALATISTTQTASGNNLLALGAITHNAGGTVNFSLGGTLSVNNAITTTTANSNGILGGWATYAGTSYAANDGAGNIVAYTGYTPIATGATIANVAASNVQVQTTGTVALSAANATTTDINTLSISSAATGATTVTVGTAGAGSTGILRLGANGGLMVATGGGSLTIGNVANNGTLTAGGAPNTAGEITFNGVTVNSKITNNGTGAVTVTINGGTLNAANTYSGGTFIQAGFTQAGNTTSFGSGAVTLLQGTQAYLSAAGTYANDFYVAGGANGDGALRLDINTVLSGKITLIGDARIGARNRNGTFSGQITGNYAVEFGSNVANGSITLSNASGTNFNNWTGNTNINTTVILGSNTGDLLPDGSSKGNVNIANSNVLELNGKTETINGLTGGGSVRNNATATNVTFTIGNNDATSTYGGNIVDHTSGTGTVAITKIGSGALTLSGTNTYTGNTTIQAGTVALSAGSTNNIASSSKIIVGDTAAHSSAGLTVSGLTSGTLIVASGQTLGGFGTVTGSVGTAGSTSVVAPGNSNGLLTISGGFTLGSGALNIQLDKTSAVQITTPAQRVNGGVQQYDQLAVTGTVNLTGGALALEVGQKLTAGDVYYILDNQGTGSNGTFTSGSINGAAATIALISGSTYSFSTPTYSFTLNYADTVSGTANDLSLTAVTVPEPSTCVALLGVGNAALLMRRRRKTELKMDV